MNKWRIYGAFLIIMAMLVMLIPATEADAESASAFSIKNGELVKYRGSETSVSVPNTVTSIGKGAFENNTKVEKIILPDSVTQINAYAFWGCDRLRTVTLGKGLSTVGDFAFTNCTGLKTMTIPKNIHSIGIQAFSACKNLEDITIPPEVVDIRDDAFDGDYLLNIHCEEGSYADKYAKDFYERQKNMPVYIQPDTGNGNTASEDKPYRMPSEISKDGVYSGADVQRTVPDTWIPDEPAGSIIGSTTVVANQAIILNQKSSIPVIGDYGVFGGAGGVASAHLTGGIGASDNVYTGLEALPQDTVDTNGKVAERAHYRDGSYEELSLFSGVREIGEFAYARTGLREAVLPEGVEKIDYAAFYHCDKLSHVVLPESVNSVEAKAFAHTPWVERFLTGSGQSDTSDFLISGGVLIAYRGSEKEVTVPEGVRVIAGEVFADHKEIEKMNLPASLQVIQEDAFTGCNKIDIHYDGDALSDEVIEESVNVQSLSAFPMVEKDGAGEDIVRKPPFYVWILAACLFCGGIFCIMKGSRIGIE